MWRDRLHEFAGGLWARPLIPAALALVAGVEAGARLEDTGHFPLFFCVPFALGFLVLSLLGSRGPYGNTARVALPVLFLLAFAFGLILGMKPLQKPDEPGHVATLVGNRITLEGVIDRAPERGAKTSHVSLKAETCTQEGQRSSCHGKVMIYVRDTALPWRAGDRVSVSLTLRPSFRDGNPGGFDYATYMQRRGYWVRGFVRSAGSIRVLASPSRVSFIQAIERTRSRLAVMIDEALPPAQATLAKALSIGMRKDLPPEIREVFLASGTAHLLAISGLHIGVMAFWVYWLLQGFWRRWTLGLRYMTPDRAAALATLPFVWGAALLSGLQVSALRAAIMISVYLLARLLWRRSDSLTSVSLAVIVVLVTWPYALQEVGFRLSFVSVLSIVLGVPRLTGLLSSEMREWMEQRSLRWRMVRYMYFMAAISLVTFLATAPILAADFHVLSWSGLFTNLAVPPLYGLIIPLFGLAVLAGLIHSSLAFPFLWLGAQLSDISISGQRWLYEWIGGFAYWQTPPDWVVWAFYLVLLATMLALPTERGWRGEPESELLSAPGVRRRVALCGLLACLLVSVISLSPLGERRLSPGEAWIPDLREGTLLLSVDEERRTHVFWSGPLTTKQEQIERQPVPQMLWGLGRRRADVFWLDGARRLAQAREVFREVSAPESRWFSIWDMDDCALTRGLRVCATSQTSGALWRVASEDREWPAPLWVQARAEWVLVVAPRPHRVTARGWRDFASAFAQIRGERRVVVVQMGPGRVESFGALCESLRPDAVVLAMNPKLTRYLSQKDWQLMTQQATPVFRTDRDGAIHIDPQGTITARGQE